MATPRVFELTEAIIAGGSARRLNGRVKPLLRREGRTLLAHLQFPVREVLLVTNDEASFREHFSGRVIADVERDRGAPGGVVSALLAATTEWVLIIAGDMPFIELGHVEALLEQAGPVDAVVATRHERLEPLFGLYRSMLGPRWRAQLEREPALRELVEQVSHARVPLDPHALESVNTPADVARFQLE